jgi:hypothetical protein
MLCWYDRSVKGSRSPAGPRPHRSGIVSAAILAAALGGFIHSPLPLHAAAPPARLLDRVVAVVNNRPILESDITLARLCHLVPDLDGLPAAKARSKLVEARVRLEVQYQDLEASGTIYRLRFDPELTYRELLKRARVPVPPRGAQPPPRGAAVRRLAASGLTLDDIRDLAIRIAAVNAYVEQRLRPQVLITLPELRLAYQQTLAQKIAAHGETPPPFAAVRSRLRRVLVERKLNRLIETWIAQARSRLDVTLLNP